MASKHWEPKPHGLVLVKPDEGEASPPGTWQILSHGPGSPTSWWLMPISGDAIRWATDNPNQVISRCVQAEGRRLVSAHQHALNRALPR